MDAAGNIHRIALYGPFGWGNLGDASIQEAMIHNLRLRLPGVEFLGISLNPDNTTAIHGIPAVPILRSWSRPPAPAPAPDAGAGATGVAAPTSPGAAEPASPRLPTTATAPVSPLRRLRALAHPAMELLRELRFRARAVGTLRQVDVFVVSGGGQISDDWGGPWDHPYSLLAWMACARLAGARVYVVSVGAGPIRKPLSGRLLHWALRTAHYRSYRDVGSHALLCGLGFTRLDPVYPDLAFSLQLPPRSSTGNSATSGRPLLVGLSPMAYFYPKAGPWPEQDRARYDRYLQAIAGFAAATVAAGHGVLAFLSQIRNDRYALDDLMRDLDSRLAPDTRHRVRAEATNGLPRLLAQIAHLDVVLTSRLHGVILSYLQHKPVIALSYDPKIEAVMAQFGQEAYCLDIEQVTPEMLSERLESLLRDGPAIESRIAATATAHRALLDRQYDLLFGRAGGGYDHGAQPASRAAG